MISKKNIILIIVAVIIVGAVGYFWWSSNNQPAQLDDFAKCLKDKGVTFYGAFWCPHCQNQKALFGSSKKYLPYVECSTPDSNGQLKVCTDANIQVYPTWKFADGSTQEGELTLQELATKSGCVLPK